VEILSHPSALVLRVIDPVIKRLVREGRGAGLLALPGETAVSHTDSPAARDAIYWNSQRCDWTVEHACARERSVACQKRL
jgi:hypothetical protein